MNKNKNNLRNCWQRKQDTNLVFLHFRHDIPCLIITENVIDQALFPLLIGDTSTSTFSLIKIVSNFLNFLFPLKSQHLVDSHYYMLPKI